MRVSTSFNSTAKAKCAARLDVVERGVVEALAVGADGGSAPLDVVAGPSAGARARARRAARRGGS